MHCKIRRLKITEMKPLIKNREQPLTFEQIAARFKHEDKYSDVEKIQRLRRALFGPGVDRIRSVVPTVAEPADFPPVSKP